MPKKIARIGDRFQGICTNHDSTIAIDGTISSAPQDFSYDIGTLIAVDGSQGTANCGHVGNVIASSILFYINGTKVALIGDRVIGQGIQANIIEGSPLTNSD